MTDLEQKRFGGFTPKPLAAPGDGGSGIAGVEPRDLAEVLALGQL